MVKKIVIVGGGLVGAMDAIFFAQRGESVELYELREDIRATPEQRGRSINLALSARGLAALKAVGLELEVQKMMIPMYGRMLHGLDGSLTMSPYGVFGEAINSIDRRKLNELLLNKAETFPNVKLFFRYDLQTANFDSGEVIFQDKIANKTVKVNGDLVIGADGAYSSVRKELMRRSRMDFQQEYIEHGYMELSIRATPSGKYAMHSNSLHIWPRRSFMMIALPNLDKTFTLTLFMPFKNFESITNEEELMAFFETEFPDSIALIGRKDLIDMFFKNPVGSLVSIKCSPYHYKDKAVIIGDASHAMVPFYGQGMNCGFEDCLVLDTFLYEKGHKTRAAALEAYSAERHHDLVAICDLALRNYEEMRSNVLDVSYRVRKVVEGSMHYFFPRLVIPLYTMVSFTTIPYSAVVKRWKMQTRVLYGLAGGTLGAAISLCGWGLYRFQSLVRSVSKGSVSVVEEDPLEETKTLLTTTKQKVVAGGSKALSVTSQLTQDAWNSVRKYWHWKDKPQ